MEADVRIEETSSGQEREAVTTPAVEVSVSNGSQNMDVAKVRELVLQAHPDAVPELVRGGSVDELLASVEPAKAAYQRIAERVRGGNTASAAEPAVTVNAEGQTTVATPPVVPAGGAANVAEPADLTPQTKIARALEQRRRK